MFGKFGIIHPQSDPIVDTFARPGADGIANSPSQTSNCDTNSSKMIFLGLSDDLASVKTLKKQSEPVEGWRRQNTHENCSVVSNPGVEINIIREHDQKQTGLQAINYRIIVIGQWS